MKKEWVKPEIRFTTDPDIILGCLYEVYGQEKKAVMVGKNIRHTMIFPFLPKRVVKDFLIKFTKRPQKKCQKHFHAPDTQASRVTCGRLAVRRKCTHIPAVGRYRVSSAA